MTAPRLLLLAPLRLEAMAVGGGERAGGDAVSVAVRRIGMGPTKAAAAARRLSAEVAANTAVGSGPLAQVQAVAVAGLGGALDDTLVPGDVVVAERLIDPQGRMVARLANAAVLAGELSRAGLRPGRARWSPLTTSSPATNGRRWRRWAPTWWTWSPRLWPAPAGACPWP